MSFLVNLLILTSFCWDYIFFSPQAMSALDESTKTKQALKDLQKVQGEQQVDVAEAGIRFTFCHSFDSFLHL